MKIRTVSEKVASVFEVVGYVLLVPGVLSMFFPAFFLIASVAAPSVYGITFGLIPLVIFGLGIFLLVKYHKHSRGRLAEDKILRLWLGTLAYNLMFLLPALYFAGNYFAKEAYAAQTPDVNGYTFLYGLFVTWWTTAVCLSLGAIVSEVKWSQKYL